LRADPDNDNPPLNPWWTHARSVTGPRYRPEPYAAVGRAGPQGQVLRLPIDAHAFGQRRLFVYSPPGLAREQLPLVLFQDGKAYFGWGRVPQVLDRLLAANQVAPAHLVFVPPVQRTHEYAFNEAYLRFVVEELLPLVEQRVACDGNRIVWGASLGGLASGLLAWNFPQLFQTVVAQSGAFLFSPDMDLDNPYQGNEWFLEQIGCTPGRPLRWYLDCGTLEWLLASNQRLDAALRQHGHESVLCTRHAGHNWMNWRNGLADAFRFALAPGS